MGMLRIMSRQGDVRVAWDTRQGEAGVPEAQSAVAEAERIFGEYRLRGATAFKVETNQLPVRIDHFDPEAEQIVLVPRVIGG
jgi:hypothetical protein